jgi:hypothetical protein
VLVSHGYQVLLVVAVSNRKFIYLLKGEKAVLHDRQQMQDKAPDILDEP